MKFIMTLSVHLLIAFPLWGEGVISFYHIVVKAGDDLVEVIESFSIEEELAGLELELPEGFFDLRPTVGFTEADVRVSNRRLSCDMSLKPGVFSFRYKLRAARSLDLSRSFPFKVEKLTIVSEEDISIPLEGFRQGKTFDPWGREVRVYSMGAIEAGKHVELVLRFGSNSPRRAIWFAASAAFVLLFALFYALILMRRVNLARSGGNG